VPSQTRAGRTLNETICGAQPGTTKRNKATQQLPAASRNFVITLCRSSGDGAQLRIPILDYSHGFSATLWDSIASQGNKLRGLRNENYRRRLLALDALDV
jgi:hypothetical protein